MGLKKQKKGVSLEKTGISDDANTPKAGFLEVFQRHADRDPVWAFWMTWDKTAEHTEWWHQVISIVELCDGGPSILRAFLDARRPLNEPWGLFQIEDWARTKGIQLPESPEGLRLNPFEVYAAHGSVNLRNCPGAPKTVDDERLEISLRRYENKYVPEGVRGVLETIESWAGSHLFQISIWPLAPAIKYAAAKFIPRPGDTQGYTEERQRALELEAWSRRDSRDGLLNVQRYRDTYGLQDIFWVYPGDFLQWVRQRGYDLPPDHAPLVKMDPLALPPDFKKRDAHGWPESLFLQLGLWPLPIAASLLLAIHWNPDAETTDPADMEAYSKLLDQAESATRAGTLKTIPEEGGSATRSKDPPICVWCADFLQWAETKGHAIPGDLKHLLTVSAHPQPVRPIDSGPCLSITTSLVERIIPPSGTLAEKLGITDWKQLTAICTLEGLQVKRLGSPGRARKISWAELGMDRSKEGQRLLMELAQCSASRVANPKTNARRVLICRINKAFKKTFGLEENPLKNVEGFQTTIVFSIRWEKMV